MAATWCWPVMPPAWSRRPPARGSTTPWPGGRFAAQAADAFCATGDVRSLKLARKGFMKAHGRVFWVLGIMQRFWYSSDKRRERFVKMCADPDVQQLTWEAYMNKRLVRAKPAAHVRVFFKDLGHLLGIVSAK